MSTTTTILTAVGASDTIVNNESGNLNDVNTVVTRELVA